MKNLFTLFALTAFVLTFQSFNMKVKEDKLIGTWKIASVVYESGRVKKGNRTITFSEDGSLVSVKDSGIRKSGLWQLEGEKLHIFDQSGERSERFIIQKLTRNKLVIKDKRKTYTSIRVE